MHVITEHCLTVGSQRCVLLYNLYAFIAMDEFWWLYLNAFMVGMIPMCIFIETH